MSGSQDGCLDDRGPDTSSLCSVHVTLPLNKLWIWKFVRSLFVSEWHDLSEKEYRSVYKIESITSYSKKVVEIEAKAKTRHREPKEREVLLFFIVLRTAYLIDQTHPEG